MADPAPTNVDFQKQPEIQVFYFNGFGVGFSSADMGILVNLDNVSMLELKASFTTMKTLALALTEAVERFEHITKNQIMTSQVVAKAISESTKSKEKQA